MSTNFWKNKRILITGFSGFKGSWMTLLLSRLGSNVYGYSLNNKLDKKNNSILKKFKSLLNWDEKKRNSEVLQ